MEAVVVVVPNEFGATSSLVAVGDEEGMEACVETAAAPAGCTGADGEEKKEVIDALAFGFLTALVATSAALRFIGVAMLLVVGYLNEKTQMRHHL